MAIKKKLLDYLDSGYNNGLDRNAQGSNAFTQGATAATPVTPSYNVEKTIPVKVTPNPPAVSAPSVPNINIGAGVAAMMAGQNTYTPQFVTPNPVITNPNLQEVNQKLEEEKGVTPQPSTTFDKYVNARIEAIADKNNAVNNTVQNTVTDTQKPSAQSQPVKAPTVDTTAIDAIIAQIMSGNYGQDPTTTDRYKMYENMYRQQALREKDNAAAALGGRGYADNMVKAAADQAEYARMSQLPLVADQILDEQKNDLLTRYNLLKGERDYQQSLADADYKRQLAEREYADDKAYRDWQMDMSEREFAQKYGTTASAAEDRVNQAILSLTSSENFDPSQMETYKAMLKYQGYSDAEIEQIVAGIRNIQNSQFQDYINKGGYGANDIVNSSGLTGNQIGDLNAGMGFNAVNAYKDAITNPDNGYEFAGVSAEDWANMSADDRGDAIDDALLAMRTSGRLTEDQFVSAISDDINEYREEYKKRLANNSNPNAAITIINNTRKWLSEYVKNGAISQQRFDQIINSFR